VILTADFSAKRGYDFATAFEAVTQRGHSCKTRRMRRASSRDRGVVRETNDTANDQGNEKGGERAGLQTTGFTDGR